MSTIYQEVTSPARLKRIIDSLGLYPDIRKQDRRARSNQWYEKAITVEQVSAMGANASAFRITYKGRNPAQTAQVTNQLTAMFIEENLKVREEQSYGTSDFIEGELEKTEKQLQEKENELARDPCAIWSGPARIRAVLSAGGGGPSTAIAHCATANSPGSAAEADLQSLAASTAPTVDLDLGAIRLSLMTSQAEELQTKLNSTTEPLRTKPPRCAQTAGRIGSGQGKASGKPGSEDSDAYRSQDPQPGDRGPVGTAGSGYSRSRRSWWRNFRPRSSFTLRSFRASRPTSKRSGMFSVTTTLCKGRYRSLLDKKMAAETATAMESREKSERFVILDSAQVPERPYSPNRPLVYDRSDSGAYWLALESALAREVVDDSVRNEREAERILGASVLSGVPEILILSSYGTTP